MLFQGFRVVVGRNKHSRILMKEAKYKTLIKQVEGHLHILKKRRECMIRQTRGDIGQLLQGQQFQKALGKVDQLYKDQSLLSAYDQIEQFCGCIATNMPQIRSTTDDIIGFESFLPVDVLEAASSLVFAASRCGGELQELDSVRYLLKRHFGYQFDVANVELKKGNHVNSKMIHNLCMRVVSDDEKLKVIKEIAEERNLQSWFQDFADKRERFSLAPSWGESDDCKVVLKDCSSLDSSIDNKLKEQNGNLSYPSHVHPKLPEYEDVVAKLTGLKLKFEETIPVPGHCHQALKSSSSESNLLREHNCKVLLMNGLSLDSSFVRYSSHHVHPKLPEYEDVVAKLAELKMEYKQRRACGSMLEEKKESFKD